MKSLSDTFSPTFKLDNTHHLVIGVIGEILIIDSKAHIQIVVTANSSIPPVFNTVEWTSESFASSS